MEMATQIQVSVFLYMFVCAVRVAYCDTYHIAFLGRNKTLSPHVATIFSLTQNAELPNITTAAGNCAFTYSYLTSPSVNSFEILFNGTACSSLIPSGTEISAKGIKIESAANTVVHVYQTGEGVHAQTIEGYLAIPDQYLGNEYYVVTYCSMGGICQFAVAGITNATYVHIIFPDNVTVSSVCDDSFQLPSSAPSGSSVPFEINEYEVLHFESESDLTGTYIWSDYSVSVFAGARDVPTAAGSPSATSYLIEQLPPVSKWGTTFIAAPNYLNDAGDIVKIVAKDDNTMVHISGFSPFQIPNKGGFIEKRIDWQMNSRIEASYPVLIVQVMSVDIYNESSDITGTPAMVLVPHIEQWTANSESPFYCNPVVENQTLIAVVSDTVNSPYIPVQPSPSVFFSSWTAIDGTDYSVQMFEPFASETMVYGPKQSTYGFCDGTAALLLRANWTWDNEECIRTAVSPGDDVDNDCDGQIDEDVCTGEDLVTTFTSQQNSSGGVNFKTLTIRGGGYILMNIKTCDIAMVTLFSNYESTQSMNIQISPTSISAEFCSSGCTSAIIASRSAIYCEIVQSYVIKWSLASSVFTYTIVMGNEELTWQSPAADADDYDQVIVSAFTGSAEFEINLPEKDCKKVPRVYADTHGSQFFLPVHETDRGFIVLMSAHTSVTSTIAIDIDVANTLGSIGLQGDQTITFSDADITESIYDKITLQAVGGEISVFLFRLAHTGILIETQILPTCVLGPSYHLFKQTDTDVTITGAICDVYAATREANTNAGTVQLGINLEVDQQIYDDLGSSHRIKSDRPLAVFCGTLTDTMIQMPPVETLGKQYYIPELNLTDITAAAEVLVIATHDSTVVTIRGDYDQMDTVNLAGDYIIRAVADKTIYNITATRPVQVHLQVRSAEIATVVLIPPVEQYKTEHVFPGLIDGFDAIFSSSAVNSNGNKVPNLISAYWTSTNAVTHVYPEPTFTLTIMQHLNLAVDKYFIMASDVLYNDINEVCTLTTGTPGDGVDNDCDGLIDEEQCSDSTMPGTVDFDIDGSLHEDCADGTNTIGKVLQRSIPSSLSTCRSVSVKASNTTSNDSIEISGTNTADDSDILTSPKVPTKGIGNPFEPFVIVSPILIVHIPTPTAGPGSTTAPEETCHTRCSCPCGWVIAPYNYTKEELAATVIELQEKLAVKKEELSASIRKKTSASDDRTSATAVGIVGLAFLVGTLGTVAFLDIATLIRDIQLLAVRMKTTFVS